MGKNTTDLVGSVCTQCGAKLKLKILSGKGKWSLGGKVVRLPLMAVPVAVCRKCGHVERGDDSMEFEQRQFDREKDVYWLQVLREAGASAAEIIKFKMVMRKVCADFPEAQQVAEELGAWLQRRNEPPGPNKEKS